MPTLVLQHSQIKARITRIAWQIFEEYQNQEQVIIAGIANSGYALASLIYEEYTAIADVPAELIKVSLHKENPLEHPVEVYPADFCLEHKNVVLVDDVLHSGKTLIYGVKYLLEQNIHALTTAVLVDRNHKRYPVKVDFKGLSLSTSLKDHVKVHIQQEPYSVEIF